MTAPVMNGAPGERAVGAVAAPAGQAVDKSVAAPGAGADVETKGQVDGGIVATGQQEPQAKETGEAGTGGGVPVDVDSSNSI